METSVWSKIDCGKGEAWNDQTGFTNLNVSVLNAFNYMDRNNWTDGLKVNGSCTKYTTAAQEYFR